MSTKVVGLDLGTHTVKVCELVTTFRNYELVGFASEGVESEQGAKPTMAEVAQAARRLLERRGLLLDPIWCAMPPENVSTLTVELPFSQPKKIEQALPFQLEELLPVDLDTLVYDYQIVRQRPDGSVSIVVAYTKRTLFEELLAALQAEGVDPKVIGIGALAFDPLIDSAIGLETQTPVAVLDIGHVHTELAVLDGGRTTTVRAIRGGGLDVTKWLAQAFQVNLEQAERGKHAEGVVALPGGDATRPDFVVDTGQTTRRDLIVQACHAALQPIAREVKRTLVAHADTTGAGVDRLFLTGGSSLLRGLPEYLQALLGIEVVLLDPLNVPYNRLTEGGDRLRPYAGKALGMALRAFERARRSEINYRKGEYAYTGDFSYLRGRLLTLAAAAVLMLLLGGMVAVTQKRVLEAENAALVAQVKALSVPILGEESDDVDRLWNVMLAAGDNPAKLVPQVSAFQVLADVSKSVQPDLVIDLDQFEMDLDRKKLEMKGRTTSGGEVERLVEVLEGHKCFKDKVSKEKVEKTMEDKTKFRLTATSGCT